MLLILSGCGTESISVDGCGFDDGRDRISLRVTNNTDNNVEYGFSSIRYERDSPISSINVVTNSTGMSVNVIKEGAQFSFFPQAECSDFDLFGPPPDDKEIYYIWFFRLIENEQTHNYIAVGGSREDYEANFLTNDDYLAALPLDAEILGYNFLYIPGTTRRSALGLQEPSGTYGMYSDVDDSRRTTEYRFWANIHLTINGTSKDDFVWSIRD